MSAAGFFANSIRDLHQALNKPLEELTPEQLHFRPENKGNHIAFTMWHYTRTEDNIVSALQQRDSVWLSQTWHTRLGLPEKAQGSGMSQDEAANIHLSSIGEFKEYVFQVWKNTDDYLAALQDSDLEKVITLGRMGERTVINLLGNVLLTHGYTHVGEIAEIRCLLG